MPYAPELKEAAKRLYLRRCKPREIQAQLSLPNIRIVYYWIRQGEWDDMLSDEEPLTAVGRRITLLLDKATSLTKGDLDELDRLTTIRDRLLKQSAKTAPALIGDPQADDGQRREGFDPAKSSFSGLSRAMGQVANLPLVLLEADRNTNEDNTKAFEWDQFKDFYGGGTLRTRGVKSNSNDTYEPPFRASIVIAQNAIVTGHEAIISRIFRLPFLKPVITEASRKAADAIVQTELEHVSHFMVKAMRAESQVLKRFAEMYPKYRAELWASRNLSSDRVIKNHSMMLALLDCLQLVIAVPEHMVQACRKYILKAATERQAAISTDPKEVNEFWQVFDYLESLPSAPLVNHSKKKGVIAINLNQFAEVALEHRQRIPDLAVLRRLLKDCRAHQCLDTQKRVESVIRARQQDMAPTTHIPSTMRCFIFRE